MAIEDALMRLCSAACAGQMSDNPALSDISRGNGDPVRNRPPGGAHFHFAAWSKYLWVHPSQGILRARGSKLVNS